jgi:hypothetical protein
MEFARAKAVARIGSFVKPAQLRVGRIDRA